MSIKIFKEINGEKYKIATPFYKTKIVEERNRKVVKFTDEIESVKCGNCDMFYPYDVFVTNNTNKDDINHLYECPWCHKTVWMEKINHTTTSK